MKSVRLSVMLLLTLFLSTGLGAGCRKNDAGRAAIGGEVRLDGKPLEKGSILFVPIDGTKGAATGGPIENGRYQLPRQAGAAVGWNRVEIRATRSTGKMIQYAPGTSPSMEILQLVAPQFNAKSTLKINVQPETNTSNVDVASP